MIACQLSASHDPLESLGGNFPNGPDNVFGKGAHAFPDGFPVFRCIKFHAHQGAAYAFPSVGIVEITEGSQIRDAFHEVKEGAIFLAARADAPIVPIRLFMERRKVFKSWDRFQLPLPFSRVSMVCADAYRVAIPKP